MGILSNTSKELSSLRWSHPFNAGQITYRLSPLERYPIIRLNDSRYIIPNIRYFLTSFTNILHFLLQDLYRNNEFNETFGSVYEQYIVDFSKDRLPKTILVPEIRYKKANNYVDGPDLTIIDKENNSLILIEVKSKNLRIDSRLNPTSPDVLDDMKRALYSLEKLPVKLKDLYHGYKEYSRWQNDINLIDKNNVYFCIVIGKGIYYLPEIVNLLKEQDSSHFLNHFDYKYAIMENATFERGVELVYANKTTLPNVVETYWKSSVNNNQKELSAEQLGGLNSDSEDIYLKKYFTVFSEQVGRI